MRKIKVHPFYKRGGYDPVNDVVWLDLSSRGEVIEIQNLRIGLPKPPKKKSEILYSDKKKKDQMWIYEDIPEELDSISTSAEWEDLEEYFKEKPTRYPEIIKPPEK